MSSKTPPGSPSLTKKSKLRSPLQSEKVAGYVESTEAEENVSLGSSMKAVQRVLNMSSKSNTSDSEEGQDSEPIVPK